MVDAAYGPLVHRALLERVAASDFPSVTYEDRGGEMVLGDSQPAKTARTGETSSRWDPAKLNRLSRQQRDRAAWRWELVLGFDKQVSLEDFERSLGADPPRVLRDDTHSRQMTLMLESATYVHPPQNQPSNGTRATFTFAAEFTPL